MKKGGRSGVVVVTGKKILNDSVRLLRLFLMQCAGNQELQVSGVGLC